jgi:large subunit ribosomal protein L35
MLPCFACFLLAVSCLSAILAAVVNSSISVRNPMPKLKTHSGAAKRFKKTGTGKFKRGQSKMRHILTSKATKTKSKLGKIVLVSVADTPKVARMLPYA